MLCWYPYVTDIVVYLGPGGPKKKKKKNNVLMLQFTTKTYYYRFEKTF